MEKSKRLFCFGYGYTSDYLGHELEKFDAWALAGTTRDNDKRARLRERGVEAHIFDYQHPLADPSVILKGVTHLLISTPPEDEGDPSFNMHAQDILKIPSLEWVGYLSTTGVYGNRDGEWVDESDETIPSSQRGSKRLKAEEQWLSLQKDEGLPVHIFRLAGIYGPGRSALDSIRAGVARRIDKPGHAFSRIHVEDIVRVLMASMERPNPGAIYNVCDDVPAPSHEVILEACNLLGQIPPEIIPFEKADLAPITRSFYADNKRIKNDKIKQELGVELKYKDFKAGLRGCLEAEDYATKTLFSGMGS
ncbi:MAG: SDR family oxidoreductase [Alphaproteobacteria bacterium]|nr:SDR family oxidoreductase [Alphaproteobacteria bacterium]